MQAYPFPPSRGLLWLQTGFALWRKAPLVLSGGFMTLLMSLLILTILIPGLGPMLAVFALHSLQAGYFLVCDQVARDQRPQPFLIFSCFNRRTLPPMCALGAVWLLAIFAVLLLSILIVGFDLAEFRNLLSQPLPDPAETQKKLQQIIDPLVMTCSLLALPLSMVAYFASLLIALQRLPLGKSLFFSLVACWRNRYALTACVGLCLLLSLLLSILLDTLAPALARILELPVILVMLPVLYASLYAATRDIFQTAWSES